MKKALSILMVVFLLAMVVSCDKTGKTNQEPELTEQEEQEVKQKTEQETKLEKRKVGGSMVLKYEEQVDSLISILADLGGLVNLLSEKESKEMTKEIEEIINDSYGVGFKLFLIEDSLNNILEQILLDEITLEEVNEYNDGRFKEDISDVSSLLEKISNKIKKITNEKSKTLKI